MTYEYDMNKITPTVNKTGSSWVDLDEYQQFFLKTICKDSKVLEVGSGYGYLANELLVNGHQVICNDIEQKHLDAISNNTTKEKKDSLITICSPAQKLKFQESIFDAIACCLVIHFFKNEEIEMLLKHFSEWLKDGGIGCLTCVTPYFGACKSFQPQYEINKKTNPRFPGNINNLNNFLSNNSDPNVAPITLNVLDLNELESLIQESGFKILKSGYIEDKYYPDDLKNNGKECVGVIFKR